MPVKNYFTPKRAAAAISALALAVVLGVSGSTSLYTSAAESSDEEVELYEKNAEVLPRVETLHPKAGGIARTTAQPGSAHSYESAELFAKVSGYLSVQNVDIGSVVKRGQLLAELDVPELNKELEFATAAVQQAEAEVKQTEARIESAAADQRASEAYVVQTEAEIARCDAERSFREKQYNRIRQLHELRSVEERLVDEKLDQLHAADAASRAAHSAVRTAQQQALAAAARVDQARADLLMAKAKVRVSQALLDKAKVMVGYTKITSPYDGVVTKRNFHRGAFIRAADQGGETPLLCVDRTDLMRVVVQIPDREVPYTQAGDQAKMRFDALPAHAFNGKIARIANSEDASTRTMRVEIDLPNPAGIVRDAMYGRVEFVLEPAAGGVTIPSSCLAGDASNGKAELFVYDDGHVQRRSIRIGKDTGVYVEVLGGLSTDDLVVMRPSGDLADGGKATAVQVQHAGH